MSRWKGLQPLTSLRSDHEASNWIVKRHRLNSTSRARLFDEVKNDLNNLEKQGVAGEKVYCAVAKLYGKLGLTVRAIAVKDKMISLGHKPTIDIYIATLTACATRGELLLFNQLWKRLLESGIPWKEPEIIHQVMVVFLKVGAPLTKTRPLFYSLCAVAPPNKFLVRDFLGSFDNYTDAETEVESLHFKKVIQKNRISKTTIRRGLLRACANGKDSDKAVMIFSQMTKIEKSDWDYEAFIMSQSDYLIAVRTLQYMKVMKIRSTPPSYRYSITLCTTLNEVKFVFDAAEAAGCVNSTVVAELLQFYINQNEMKLALYLAHHKIEHLKKDVKGRELLAQLKIPIFHPTVSTLGNDTRSNFIV